jgi:hypothetical protein
MLGAKINTGENLEGELTLEIIYRDQSYLIGIFEDNNHDNFTIIGDLGSYRFYQLNRNL